ncbi:hypothetical protein SAMN00017477_1051 [Peptoniphilus asaccharolyticus DSM 20463]|uniref:Exodeoxyribonuclease X-like C-terminal domain-containing protein n=1 Tax=Peptoniphilus asaccharolyticus DSM 20463 TaxID=573058 RepID=A0A1W1V1P1_PEPAS|nr:hypothetical protein [Peptoniphilus asaccharolyticus]SMB87210.1 hypothetical protein SAMN00017477_1051 [Peptoniphilus asaccharolyticus DSM 20463]
MNNELMNLIDAVELDAVSASLNKVASVQAVIQRTLKGGHDYDTIPGTQKPTLLKPGAEKILMMFGLTSEYEIVDSIEDWKNGVFAYTVRCILSKNGAKITEGLGNCNSKEDKYRYRWVRPEDVPIGIDPNTLKANNWGKVRVENDEIYSQVNTILKMAKKRAQVDATLTVASLSEVFTQDIEDMKQFAQAEKIDNMNSEDAKRFKVNFGKHKGMTLGEIINSDKGYIKWISENAKDLTLREGAAMLLEANKEAPKKEEVHEAEQEETFFDLKNEDLPF